MLNLGVNFKHLTFIHQCSQGVIGLEARKWWGGDQFSHYFSSWLFNNCNNATMHYPIKYSNNNIINNEDNSDHDDDDAQ